MPPPTHRRRWSAVVFARNEAASIGRCLHALARAGQSADLHVTVLLNGCTDGSGAVAAQALREAGQAGRIYTIAEPDKANAFNQFIHALRPRADAYFFVDAYAAVAPDALERLDAALLGASAAHAAAALPSVGRSAAAMRLDMLQHPALHGSLFALRAAFLDRMARLGLRVPVGFYRSDGLIGSFVLHDLDASGGGWRPERIAVEPGATWQMQSLRPWSWADWQRQWRRLIQQGRGRLQWSAIRHAIYPGGFAALPDDADAHVLQWIADAAAERRPLPWRDPFAVLALARIRAAAPRQELTPHLLKELA